MKKIILGICAMGVMLSAGSLNAEKVANESYSHDKRIAILEDADRCIKSAQTEEAYKACENKEKEGRKAHKKEMKAKKLAQMDSRIASMPEGTKKERMVSMRNCLTSAETRDDHKSCKQKYGKKGKNRS